MLGRGVALVMTGLLAAAPCGAEEEKAPPLVRIVGPLSLVPAGAACRIELRPRRTQNWDVTVEHLEWYAGTFQNPGDGIIRLASATHEARCNTGGWPTRIPSLSRFYRSTGTPATPVAGGTATFPLSLVQSITLQAAPAPAAPRPAKPEDASEESVTLQAPLGILAPGLSCEVQLNDVETTQRGWSTTTRSRGCKGVLKTVESGGLVLKDSQEILTETTRTGPLFERSKFTYPDVRDGESTIPIEEIQEIRVLPSDSKGS